MLPWFTLRPINLLNRPYFLSRSPIPPLILLLVIHMLICTNSALVAEELHWFGIELSLRLPFQDNSIEVLLFW